MKICSRKGAKTQRKTRFGRILDFGFWILDFEWEEILATEISEEERMSDEKLKGGLDPNSEMETTNFTNLTK